MSRSRWLLAVPALLTLACRSLPAAAPERAPVLPKNVVLVVGDGMGAAHFTAARLLRGEDFETGRLPVTGLVATRSASSLVTDSAAAATAMATGVKSNNRSLGVDPEGQPLPTLLELAEGQGRATGLVTTTFIGDATPAAFAVHTARRDQVADILHQLLGSGVDVLAGGGAELFGKDGVPELPALAARHGWSLVTEPAALSGAPASKALAVFPSGKNDVDVQGPRLPELARWALERLSKDPDGFFLVVEHEGTDRAGHEGAPDDLRTSLRSFDEAVGVVADFARRRGDTLVLVVGDHETGGLRVLADASGALSLEYGTNLHTGSMVPLFAMGPGSERFGGLYENTDIARKVRALSGAEPLTAAAEARKDEGPGTGERFRALSP